MLHIGTSLAKLPNAGSDKPFVLKSIWTADEINLQLVGLLVTNVGEWKGTIAVDYLKESAKDLELPFEDFYSEVRKALCTNGGLANFEYVVEDDKFLLRKKVDSFKEIYCECVLVEEPNLLRNILLDAVDTIQSVTDELSTKQLDYQTLDMEFKMLAQSYHKSVEEKNAIEQEILKRCAVLLNAKKNKIAELQGLLAEGKRLCAQDNSENVEDDVLTQRMDFPETRRAVQMLPKRKDLLAAKAAERQAATTGQDNMARQLDRVPPGQSSDSEQAMDSEDIFDNML